MKSLLKILSWDFLLLHRNKLVLLAIAVAAIYLGLFKLLENLGDLRTLLLVLVFNDPVVTGLMFGGVIMLFEKSQNTLMAARVSPVPLEHFLASKVISLSLLATFSALLMNTAAIGFNYHFGHFLFGITGTSALFVMAGLYIGSGAKSFNQFLIRSMGFLLISALPFLGYFELMPDVYLYWLPQFAGLTLIKAAYFPVDASYLVYAYGFLSICLFIAWKRLVLHFKTIEL